jgi:NAD(P)-dependent dehydrogenase (short-subunit alcohol dehydrogenase family)
MTLSATYPSLVDRTVLVTGGATGIGATLVSRFAQQGARVGFIDIDTASGEALARALQGSRCPPLFVHADITDIPALERAIDQVRDTLGPVRVLLNNAANDKRHRIEDTTVASWDAGIAVNLRHQFFAARHVVPDMRDAGGGSIVNFGSMSWMAKQGGMPAYTTSKAAIQGLTRGLARDLGPYNIRVNTLVPGWVMTDKQLRMWVDDKAREEIARNQCINRPLMPDDIAAMALFLAADDSALCTAQDFIVDAGWT